MLIQGTLIKGYAGFYYVYADDRVWECSLRGRFRVQKQDFLPGDKVIILPSSDNKATIEKVLQRKNSLTRPSVANVDQAILVFARKTPDPDFNLLDRLLVQVAKAGIDVLLTFTKIDLVEDLADKNIEYYQSIGYRVINVSNKTGYGLKELPELLCGRISVLAGPSGAGKSSLLNSLEPGRKLKTGDVSDKIGRGRHTTRHVELLSVAGGWVADTPGFSALYLPEMKREELQNYFPEFEQYKSNCRFTSCLHDKEPVCAVKEALEEGKILSFRYEHYLQFLKEVIAKERRF
ncbi:MAG TPA: ribosome small subunit-dependent GTPase A [Peptococcaceae bacterium]|nr:ribosome small subunit-dependent GTPase A [Peptococcaceae bacterium]